MEQTLTRACWSTTLIPMKEGRQVQMSLTAMDIDRRRALAAFEGYVSAYDPNNPRIALKIDHTLRVAALCERIARAEGFAEGDVELAWLIGLLHDIGRFEQVRRFDTFNDAKSVGHAALGAEVLFGPRGEGVDEADSSPLIRRFIDDGAEDELIRLAVLLHSGYRLPDGLDERTRALCEVLRDADKVDILKVNCTCPIEDVYAVTESDMLASTLSPECVNYFYEHRCMPRDVRRHPADVRLAHICFAWELVFDESLQIVREQGHLAEMLRYPWKDPVTREAFAAIAAHMQAALNIEV